MTKMTTGSSNYPCVRHPFWGHFTDLCLGTTCWIRQIVTMLSVDHPSRRRQMAALVRSSQLSGQWICSIAR